MPSRNSNDIELTLQERYTNLTAAIRGVNIEVKNPDVDIKEIERLTEAVKSQISALQTTRTAVEPQMAPQSIYLYASSILSEYKPQVDAIMAAIASAACEATREFDTAVLRNALIFGLTRPGFISIDPVKTTPTRVSIRLNTREVLGTPQQLQQNIRETRNAIGYGGQVGIHEANLYWFIDYKAAREGYIPYRKVSYKKFKTYRKYGWTRKRGTDEIHRFDKDGNEETRTLGGEIERPDPARARRGIKFYNRVIATRIELSKGKALFWYLLEYGSHSIGGHPDGHPYPEFQGTKFLFGEGGIKFAVEQFLYTKLIEIYPQVVFQERKIVGEDYGIELDKLIALRDELLALKQAYKDIFTNLGKKDEKVFKKKFQERLRSTMSALDTELESKFSHSQLRENIAKAKLERGLLRTVMGEVPPNYRVYLGTISGKVERKRLTLLARGLQQTVPQDTEKLMSLMKVMKDRIVELDKEIARNIIALEQVRLFRRR